MNRAKQKKEDTKADRANKCQNVNKMEAKVKIRCVLSLEIEDAMIIIKRVQLR